MDIVVRLVNGLAEPGHNTGESLVNLGAFFVLHPFFTVPVNGVKIFGGIEICLDNHLSVPACFLPLYH